MLPPRVRRRRRRRLRRLALLGMGAAAYVYRNRRLAENERAVWPAGPPGRSPGSASAGD